MICEKKKNSTTQITQISNFFIQRGCVSFSIL